MRLTGTSSVDEMIAAFLRAEIDADRWAPGQVLPRLAAHGWPESLVRDPDTTSVAENTMRAALLREYRGWQTETFLFVAFPPDLEWHRTELERAEIGDVLGANFKTWYNLSGSSRRVADSAAVALVGP